MQELFPDILQQLGPKQINQLKNMYAEKGDTIKEEKDDDDVPELVNQNFEEVNEIELGQQENRLIYSLILLFFILLFIIKIIII